MNRNYGDTAPRGPAARALAALGAALITASLGALFTRDAPNAEYYATRIGEQRSLPQRDGSVITLNTNTSIKLRRDGPTTYIELFRGEVHFNMVPNPHRRLIVSIADRVDVIDTGTIFDIRLTDSGARVTVKEGEVELSIAHLSQIRLHQNQRATIDTSPDIVAIRAHNVSSQEVERQLSWLQGYLDFRCEPLANAAREFNRYNLTHIEIADEATRKVQIGGMFSTTDPKTFVEAVAEIMPTVELDPAHSPAGTPILTLRKKLNSRAPPQLGCASQSSSSE